MTATIIGSAIASSAIAGGAYTLTLIENIHQNTKSETQVPKNIHTKLIVMNAALLGFAFSLLGRQISLANAPLAGLTGVVIGTVLGTGTALNTTEKFPKIAVTRRTSIMELLSRKIILLKIVRGSMAPFYSGGICGAIAGVALMGDRSGHSAKLYGVSFALLTSLFLTNIYLEKDIASSLAKKATTVAAAAATTKVAAMIAAAITKSAVRGAAIAGEIAVGELIAATMLSVTMTLVGRVTRIVTSAKVEGARSRAATVRAVGQVITAVLSATPRLLTAATRLNTETVRTKAATAAETLVVGAIITGAAAGGAAALGVPQKNVIWANIGAILGAFVGSILAAVTVVYRNHKKHLFNHAAEE